FIKPKSFFILFSVAAAIRQRNERQHSIANDLSRPHFYRSSVRRIYNRKHFGRKNRQFTEKTYHSFKKLKHRSKRFVYTNRIANRFQQTVIKTNIAGINVYLFLKTFKY